MTRWALVSGDAAFVIVEQANQPSGNADWREVGTSTHIGDRVVNGAFVRPGLAPVDVMARCLDELAASDAQVTRVLESGEKVSKDVRDYRDAIRQIYRTGTLPNSWPTIPEYNP